jgi:cyclic pyranopterin monophosphate synthase
MFLKKCFLRNRCVPCRFATSASTAPGGLSHVDGEGKPCMVDVSQKGITYRSATARAKVYLPPAVFALIREDTGDIHGAKGPVFASAIIAATMGVKKTSDLIPFCHPLPIEHIDVQIGTDKMPESTTSNVKISCTVKTTGKTGVEMEALTGASVAALTIYDMLKAMSHDIVISEVCLESKSGGKSAYVKRE